MKAVNTQTCSLCNASNILTILGTKEKQEAESLTIRFNENEREWNPHS